MSIPNDFGDQIRRETEKKIAENLRREGIYDVTVKVDRQGQAHFDGPQESLDRVQQVLDRL